MRSKRSRVTTKPRSSRRQLKLGRGRGDCRRRFFGRSISCAGPCRMITGWMTRASQPSPSLVPGGSCTDHRNQVRLITNAQLLTDRRLLAGRIVQVLEKTDIPLKLHELVRSFSRQEKSRFDPVIDALLDTGVLSRDEKQRLSLGSVDLADVEEELAKLLVATQ